LRLAWLIKMITNSKLLLCLAFILSGGLFDCLGVPDIYTDATNILRGLLTDKTLVLSSRPKFVIQTSQNQGPSGLPTFAHVDIRAPRMIQQFGFKAQLSRPGHPITIMQVAANEDHATVLVETSGGQPYCLMVDHLLVICDPERPGGLAYYDGGTVLWGLCQGIDRTNASFQMAFMATNVPPVTILDLSFLIKSTWSKKTNASYEVGSRTIRIRTMTSLQEIKLSNDPHDSFGIEAMKLHNGTVGFDFSDFQIGTTPINGLFQFSKSDLRGLNVSLRALYTGEFNHLALFIPDGFPDMREAKASEKLQSMIKTRMSE
jgi:hypothetical protein